MLIENPAGYVGTTAESTLEFLTEWITVLTVWKGME